MKIDHLFLNFNTFGGAEEHLTSLAELQKAQGDDVTVCLVGAVAPENQYAKRLRAAEVPIRQLPLWLSRLIGDWDTREAILRFAISGLAPLIIVIAHLLALLRAWPRERARKSVEGRLRTALGALIDSRRQQQLFQMLISWQHHWRRPDVLHIHAYGTGLDFFLDWARARGIATVYQEHSTPDVETHSWRGLPTGLNAATLVVAVSETSAQALRRLCAVARPIEVVPPILGLNALKTDTSRPPRSAGDTVHVVTIARLSEEKGLSYLIQAAQLALAANPNIRFAIYGDGPLRESLDAQIHAAHLSNKVCLAGRFSRDELGNILTSADIFVLSSITEGFPVTLVEAMAWGLPIVATAVGGVPELAEDGVTALLCPARDVDGLARAILTLASDPSRSVALGAAARKSYDSPRFRPDWAASQFTRIYNKALQMQRL